MDTSKDFQIKKPILEDMSNAIIYNFQKSNMNTISKYIHHAAKPQTFNKSVEKCIDKCKEDENLNLKGIRKYLNSSSITGRANVAKLTLGTIAVYGLYKYFSTPAGHARG